MNQNTIDCLHCVSTVVVVVVAVVIMANNTVLSSPRIIHEDDTTYIMSESAETQKSFFSNNLDPNHKEKAKEMKSFVSVYTEWKMDTEAREFRIRNKEAYDEIIGRLDLWFLKNKASFIKLFFDSFKSGEASFADFKAFLKDFGFPANNFETHLVCMLLDPLDKKGVSKYSFATRLRVLKQTEDRLDALVYENVRNATRFPNYVESYVHLRLYSLEFLTMPNFRGHQSVTLSTSCTTYELKEVLNKAVQLHHRHYRFFRREDLSGYWNLQMPDTITLEEFGIKGGPLEDPPKAKMFYSFSSWNLNCPLLRCVPFNSAR